MAGALASLSFHSHFLSWPHSHLPSPCYCSQFLPSVCSHPASPCKAGQGSHDAPETPQAGGGFPACSLATPHPSFFVQPAKKLQHPCGAKRQRPRAWSCNASQCSPWLIAAGGRLEESLGHLGAPRAPELPAPGSRLPLRTQGGSLQQLPPLPASFLPADPMVAAF